MFIYHVWWDEAPPSQVCSTSYEQQCSTSYVTECEAAKPTYGGGYGAPECSQKPQQSCSQVPVQSCDSQPRQNCQQKAVQVRCEIFNVDTFSCPTGAQH